MSMYEFSINQKIQDKVRKEIDTVLQKTNGRITYEGVMEMKYLHQCVCESLRKNPSVTVQTRVCTKKYTIPVFVSTYGLHSDPPYYPNPQLFDPERFSANQKSSIPSCAWIPFSVGPRTCIAYQFGLMEIKVGLITLLRSYKFSLHPSTEEPIRFDPKAYTLSLASVILLVGEKIQESSRENTHAYA